MSFESSRNGRFLVKKMEILSYDFNIHALVRMGQKIMTNKVAEFFKLPNKKLCTEPLIATKARILNDFQPGLSPVVWNINYLFDNFYVGQVTHLTTTRSAPDSHFHNRVVFHPSSELKSDLMIAFFLHIIKEAMSAAEATTSKSFDRSASTSDEELHGTEEVHPQVKDVLLQPGPSHFPEEISTELECDLDIQSDVSPGCSECAGLLSQNRKLSNRVKTLRGIVTNNIKKHSHSEEKVS